MPTARLNPLPSAARYIAEFILQDMDADNDGGGNEGKIGWGWPKDSPNYNTRSMGNCPYPAEIMAKLQASIQLALNCGWHPTVRELELIAAGEERSMKRVLAKIPAGQGPYIHEVMDFCFNYGWEPDRGVGELGSPPAAS